MDLLGVVHVLAGLSHEGVKSCLFDSKSELLHLEFFSVFNMYISYLDKNKSHIMKSNSLYNFVLRSIAACSSEKFFIQNIKTDLLCSLTDFQHKITVQASPNLDKRRSLNSNSSSPSSSPTIIPRLRAIQCKSPLI